VVSNASGGVNPIIKWVLCYDYRPHQYDSRTSFAGKMTNVLDQGLKNMSEPYSKNDCKSD
jgi:hypothetical protein